MEKDIFTGSSIKDELDLKKCMTQIEFGYLDNEDNIHYEIDSEFRDGFVLQSPRILMKSFVGTCFDEVELIRKFFEEKEIECKTFFIMAKGAGTVQNHAFVAFQSEDSWAWFENYWKEFEGIHYYISKERLIKDVYDKFLSKCGRISTIGVYEYSKPEYGISYGDYLEHCLSGELVHSNKRTENSERPTIPSIFMAKSMKDKLENENKEGK